MKRSVSHGQYSQVATSEDDHDRAARAHAVFVASIVTMVFVFLILVIMTVAIGFAATWGVQVQSEWRKMQTILNRAESVLSKVENMLPNKADVEHIVHEVSQGIEHVVHDFRNVTAASALSEFTSALSSIVKTAVKDMPIHPP
jgi:hypothetical protein